LIGLVTFAGGGGDCWGVEGPHVQTPEKIHRKGLALRDATPIDLFSSALGSQGVASFFARILVGSNHVEQFQRGFLLVFIFFFVLVFFLLFLFP
jgi:hypothetical protein